MEETREILKEWDPQNFIREGLCLILSGGAFSPPPRDLGEAAYVIACDRGWTYARRLGLSPDLVIGDFDSSPPPPEGAMPVLRVPTRKDDTDTMLAVKHALLLGYRSLALCCALGGRFDHSLANVQSAAYAVSHGARMRVCGEDTDLYCFSRGELRLPRREDWSLSLFALSDRCHEVTVRGCKYECRNVTLENRFPLGISNVWTREEACISCGSGILLVVQSRLAEGEHI